MNKNEELKKFLKRELLAFCSKSGITLLYACLSGSIAYGLDNEESDVDVKFVFAHDEKFYLGFGSKPDTYEFVSEYNGKKVEFAGHEIRKFGKLALSNNPNILEMLFSDSEDVIFVDNWFGVFPKCASKILSNRCKNSYYHYCINQLKKMKSFNLNDLETLERLENELVVAGVDLTHVVANQHKRQEWTCDGRTVGEAIDEYSKFRKERFNGGGRLGAKRKELIRKYGFDLKNAVHIMRLAEAGVQILTTGKLSLKSANREFLLKVKNGEIEKEKVLASVESILSMLETDLVSVVPDEPNEKFAEEHIISILQSVLFEY